MSNNVIFNVTVCIIGVLIFTIHAVNIIIKKQKRKDERDLLVFLLFTIVHFSTYLAFSIVKHYYTSDAYVITFYTIFYIMNNIEVLLLLKYMLSYVDLETKTINVIAAVNISLFVIFLVLDIVNSFTGIFFSAENGEYRRSKYTIRATSSSATIKLNMQGNIRSLLTLHRRIPTTFWTSTRCAQRSRSPT